MLISSDEVCNILKITKEELKQYIKLGMPYHAVKLRKNINKNNYTRNFYILDEVEEWMINFSNNDYITIDNDNVTMRSIIKHLNNYATSANDFKFIKSFFRLIKKCINLIERFHLHRESNRNLYLYNSLVKLYSTDRSIILQEAKSINPFIDDTNLVAMYKAYLKMILSQVIYYNIYTFRAGKK